MGSHSLGVFEQERGHLLYLLRLLLRFGCTFFVSLHLQLCLIKELLKVDVMVAELLFFFNHFVILCRCCHHQVVVHLVKCTTSSAFIRVHGLGFSSWRLLRSVHVLFDQKVAPNSVSLGLSCLVVVMVVDIH